MKKMLETLVKGVLVGGLVLGGLGGCVISTPLDPTEPQREKRVKINSEIDMIRIRLLIKGLNPYMKTVHVQNYPVGIRVFSDFEVEFLETNLEKIVLKDKSLLNLVKEPRELEYEFKVCLVENSGKVLYETKFSPSFSTLTDLPIEKNETTIELYLPYINNVNRFEIYCGKRKRLSREIVVETSGKK